MLDNSEEFDSTKTHKVLSIQSHVVHGYVGNKAATFPLQYRGWNVDVLNTVQLSNHPGYGNFTGFRSNASDVSDILNKGLLGKLNMKYDAVITGYIPCTETLELLAETLGVACKENSELKWIVDPVLGDNGKLYVSEKNVPVYKRILRDNRLFVVTPNQFEMETLTGMKINCLDSLKHSLLKFHNLYPLVDKIVITSMELPLFKETTDLDYLVCVCYDWKVEPDLAYYFKVPKLNAHFSGSGDLFTALLLDFLVNTTTRQIPRLSQAVSEVLSLVDDILQRTMDLTLPHSDHLTSRRSVINDLKLIHCADLLRREETIHSSSKFRPSSIKIVKHI